MSNVEKQDPKKPETLVQLGPNSLKGFEFVSTRFDALIPIGVSLNELSDPAFWAHHGLKVRPMDEIRARAEDGTWMANFIVLDCSRTWVKVRLLEYYPLTSADVSISQASEEEVKKLIEAHEVKHRGPYKWSIIRKSDAAIVQENIGQKHEAIAWLENHARTTVGSPAPAKRPEAVAV